VCQRDYQPVTGYAATVIMVVWDLGDHGRDTDTHPSAAAAPSR